MQAYKLTTQDNTTHNNTLWGENVTHETNGEGELCGPGWLHFYSNPHLALLLNSIHARIENPKLWIAEAGGTFMDDYNLKAGCTKLTTIQNIDVPIITDEQKVLFAILCAKMVFHRESWNEWATKWINNVDRSQKIAWNIAEMVTSNYDLKPESILAIRSAESAARAASANPDKGQKWHVARFTALAAYYAAYAGVIDFHKVIKEMSF